MALQIIFSTIVSIALFFLPLYTSANEYSSVNFSYTGPHNGPEKWGSLSPLFAACSHGESQSPVNLNKSYIVFNKDLKSLDKHYIPTNATLVNNKFNIGVQFGGKVGDININGKNYSLKQLHWHSPAEHRANGRIHVAELHLVHKSEDNEIAVIAMLYKLGNPDPIISKIEDKLIELGRGHSNTQIAIGTFYIKELNRRPHRYFRYIGSLTTPPCTEGVHWNILGKLRTISEKQLELLKGPLDPTCKINARPIQPINDRKIQMYFKPNHIS
ncbi:alpha carbonic anhydrase 1, chloroplastic [Arachis ipaensis]|uniref:alpha carbonic anhydrase 1, chloroplastic n=1 Tax=Arachis ipaensis TaxID=130454 RepID=UPI0007AF05FB|nr:alpha carbonic anhydrase 1, chloroplastic [Arachis ipaensis]